MSEFDHSTTLGRYLARLQEGHDSDRAGLLAHAEGRLRRLAAHLFRREARLHGAEDTDDVLQRALLRLHAALAAVRPGSVSELFGLASRQIPRFTRLNVPSGCMSQAWTLSSR